MNDGEAVCGRRSVDEVRQSASWSCFDSGNTSSHESTNGALRGYRSSEHKITRVREGTPRAMALWLWYYNPVSVGTAPFPLVPPGIGRREAFCGAVTRNLEGYIYPLPPHVARVIK